MAEMRLDVPKDINKQLRRYAIDKDKGSREKATIYILEQFLKEFYKMDNMVINNG